MSNWMQHTNSLVDSLKKPFVFVTGGAAYVCSVLIPKRLNAEYEAQAVGMASDIAMEGAIVMVPFSTNFPGNQHEYECLLLSG